MADPIVSALVKTILGNLNSIILQEAGLAWSYKRELKELKSKLSTIQAVLQDAEEQQLRSAATRNWLTKLKDAAYDADDLLDEYATDVPSRSLKIQVRSAFSFRNPLAFSLMMGHRIKEITGRLEGIAKERSQFHLKDRTPEERIDSSDRLQTHSFVIESQIYGREDDKRNIIKLLMDTNGPVIPIVGMGGIGKTTLAQLVYNDPKVQLHFDLRVWVCISETFDPRECDEKAIIESVQGQKYDIGYGNLMIHELKKKLDGKRFLLVLDNVWSEDIKKWDSFKEVIFNCRVKGSGVIVTSRSEKVAILLSTNTPYRLGKLSDDDCWSLFKQQAFPVGREENSKLVVIGKEIVEKCGGVPLAAKALGSMMRFRNKENQWLSVKESALWNLPDDENDILPALRLSYTYLPSSHLKQCFAYCSIFPKGYEIDKDELILQWIAHGFVPTKTRMTLEEVGNEIIDDLSMRSFFEDIERNKHGEVTKFKMHHLMSDLARVIMRNECFIVQRGHACFDSEGIRHLCCDARALLEIPSSSYRARSLRTFLLLSVNARYITSTVSSAIKNLRLLRVLVLSHTSIRDLPISVANLKHIRYLDLSYTYIIALPESFNALQNLQTLLLKYCQMLLRLPERLSDISSLRHIDISGCTSLNYMPMHIKKLTCLQTLTDFIVGKSKGSGIKELQGLDLRGELHIGQLENVRNEEDAEKANLIYKGSILSLELSWKGSDEKNDEKVLEALRPHANLKMFHLRGYGGVEIPSWMKSSLITNLTEISIVQCTRIKQLPHLGKLPLLKVLRIERMDALECLEFYDDAFEQIDGEFYFDASDSINGDYILRVQFPSLKELILNELPNLNEWPSTNKVGLFPCLAKLAIRKCPKLRTMPHIPSLQQMVLKESNELLLSFVANFTSLSSLHIGGFPDMESLPAGMLRSLSLQSFKLKDCPKLSSLSGELGNQLLTAEGRLTVWNCATSRSITENSMMEHSSVGSYPSMF